MASARKTSVNPDDFIATAGAGELPKELRKPLQGEGPAPAHDLDRRITRMFLLHPEIALEFRGQGDLADMDENTKRLLLSDIYTVLEIDPTLGTN